jgi:predicted Fe-Mo cluster-binding NifX family protein
MKVAIAALGNSVDAVYARHFATATHYFIYDTETGEIEVMENTAPQKNHTLKHIAQVVQAC